jgi:uncharacterized protein YbaP (TraB family)
MPHKLERPFFWKLRNHPVHFLGSIHLSRKDGYALPAFVMRQFETASAINFETKYEVLSIPDSRTQRATGSLISDIGEELFNIASSILLDVPNLERLNPEGVCYLHLPLSAYSREGLVSGNGVDSVLRKFANKHARRVYGLESDSQQFDALFSDCGEETLTILRRYLLDADLLRQEALDIVNAVETGDLDLLSIIRAKAHNAAPRKIKILFPDREARWVAPIERLIATHKQGIVVAGALHFAEPDGLLSRLRTKGYEFDRLEA